MKVAAIATSICLTCLLMWIGCSKDEPSSYPEEKAVVRKPIEKAANLTPPPEKITQPEVKEEKRIEANSVEEVGKDEEPAVIMEEDEGIYITEKGDSLSAIAGRKDILGDTLKWPILYRLNREKLQQFSKDSDFPDREIPEGTRLDIVTLDEAEENLVKRPKNYWVINVISSPEKDRIVSHALSLVDNGYAAYITRVKVKGKDWMRIRVGFFKERKDAEAEGNKIIAALKLSDIWITKVGDMERGEFGGY